MKKPIKIAEENRAKIKAALAEVNGKATAHTFLVEDVFTVASIAEKKLLSLVGAKKYAAGAMFYAESGDPVSNSYKYAREGNGIHLKRTSTGWFLTGVERVTLWTNSGGALRVSLTREQDEQAVAHLRAQYHTVQTPAEVVE